MNNFFSSIAGAVRGVVGFYVDGFRNMTLGRSLWALILVKLFLIFVIMKLFFFPNLLQRDYDTDEERAQHVREELYKR